MQLNNEEAIALVRQGMDSYRAGRPAEARALLERVTATGRANAQIWMMLAMACRADPASDDAAEEAALNQLLALEPRAVRGHILKADCRARAGDRKAALDFYTSALRLAEGETVPDDLRSELQRAANALAGARDDAAAEREATLAARGFPEDTRSPRFRESLEIMAGRKQIYPQAPTGYYFPGLAPIQFFDTSRFDWVPAIEAATGAILEELNGLLAEGLAGFRPYIQSDPNRPRLDDNALLDSAEWSTRFLCENGRVDAETVARCPRSWAAVQSAPQPLIANSPTAMFSLLRPGARIAPHTGMVNTRLTCHLPLVVPPGCGFRVGNETREWEVGKLLIFDDSIEHEAWNGSDRDRVVLIFDIWRPELSDQERREVGALLAGPEAG
ncbi:aspartyl/asparaginyl beta-hydroxylase domain-containing protein [Sphingomonas sp. HITSZ_GF]|uniref:aspartyl/asparaginyl beta-hydroxylase domain-containing protein n=1 Tax=Sphingomonas sp. HITSZ_GF TaxID=3037247 RepID=UPI00240D8EA4|nr:aspartyl/asparaginyl beta-hydroxylase domain-containing protein [Sphingomonas sp. HITSZ_GF]MDG2533530.1 aspartyl/asparaginyl beta-hydroxylase domain-containing protein [Sphingomonas sp. HITSZ_GF]